MTTITTDKGYAFDRDRIITISDVELKTGVEEKLRDMYLNRRGYFANNSFDLSWEIDYENIYTLTDIMPGNPDGHPFKSNDGTEYSVFLPEDAVYVIKLNGYRQFKNLKEFCDTVTFWDHYRLKDNTVIFRHKKTPTIEYRLKFNGYEKDNGKLKLICLGSLHFSPKELLESYEFLGEDKQYHTFGIKE